MSEAAPPATRARRGGQVYSTRELLAAAAALAAGEFTPARTHGDLTSLDLSSPALTSPTRPVDVAGLTGNAPGGPRGPRFVAQPGEASAGAESRFPIGVLGEMAPVVRVWAANAGAGASTIALALAEAADTAGIRVRLLDAAAPTWSGLLGATTTELGAQQGWRRGRRGTHLLIDRIENPVHDPADLPAPRTLDGIDLTVIDTGWSMRELASPHPSSPGSVPNSATTGACATGPGSWLTATPARVEVIVTRPHALALHQTEAALDMLAHQQAAAQTVNPADRDTVQDAVQVAHQVAGQVIVVIVGANGWSPRGLQGPGRRLREAHEQGAVLFAPLLGHRVLPGLGTDPLPRQLTGSAQRLLLHITTITGPLPATRT